MKRTFVAIKTNFSKELEEFLVQIKSNLKFEKIKWIECNNMHITLFFLGDTDENVLGEISEELTIGLNEFRPFSITLCGLGIFRSVYTPKVIWLGLEKSNQLIELQQKVAQILMPFGYNSSGNSFNPHISLGRLKMIQDRGNLKSLLEKYRQIYLQTFEIEDVLFYESILTAKGSIYKPITTVSLYKN